MRSSLILVLGLLHTVDYALSCFQVCNSCVCQNGIYYTDFDGDGCGAPEMPEVCAGDCHGLIDQGDCPSAAAVANCEEVLGNPPVGGPGGGDSPVIIPPNEEENEVPRSTASPDEEEVPRSTDSPTEEEFLMKKIKLLGNGGGGGNDCSTFFPTGVRPAGLFEAEFDVHERPTHFQTFITFDPNLPEITCHYQVTSTFTFFEIWANSSEPSTLEGVAAGPGRMFFACDCFDNGAIHGMVTKISLGCDQPWELEDLSCLDQSDEQDRCEDLEFVDFGFCPNNFLGYGIIWRTCERIYGCDPKGRQLFNTIRECETCLGDIHGIVWYDADRDGVYDEEENGIAGLEVCITFDEDGDCRKDFGDDTFCDTSYVDGYWFEGLVKSNFIVEMKDPSNVLDGYAPTFGVNPTCLFLDDGEVQYVNWGFALGSIHGRICHERTVPGMISNGEVLIPLAGVTVELVHDKNGNGRRDGGSGASAESIIDETYTDEQGFYWFQNLKAADYIVFVTDEERLISGWQLTFGAHPRKVQVPAGGEVDEVDFYYTNGHICGCIFNDTNANGVWDEDEMGVNGVSLELIRENDPNGKRDPGDPVLGMTMTDYDGCYSFEPLDGGTYLVDVTDSGNILKEYDLTEGSDPTQVPLDSGEEFCGVNFGYSKSAIHGIVYWDQDGDGEKDPGEMIMEGKTVHLYRDFNGNCAGDEAVEWVETTDEGFKFSAVPAGNYAVYVDVVASGLEDWDFTAVTNPACVSLSYGETIDVEFGFTTGCIAGCICKDENCNGRCEPNEPGIPMIYMDLWQDKDSNQAISRNRDMQYESTATGEDGCYEFPYVPSGSWIVEPDSLGRMVAEMYILTSGLDPWPVELRPSQCNYYVDYAYGDCATDPPTEDEIVCPPFCPDTDDTVCGSNGISFQNECLMQQEACLYPEIGLTKACSGPCPCFFLPGIDGDGDDGNGILREGRQPANNGGDGLAEAPTEAPTEAPPTEPGRVARPGRS